MFRIALHSFLENGDIEWKGVTTMKLRKMAGILVGIFLATSLGVATATPLHLPASAPTVGSESFLQREVGHQLRMLPYYTVFDILKYSVDGYQVTLDGAVTQPWLKTDAEKAVKSIEGVEAVTNNIKVLPLSPSDDRIRRAEYRAIFGQDSLFRYAEQAVPPIHIIVENGHVTLEGVVDTEMDRNLAEIRAKSVPGVFSVTNNLLVMNPPKH
jgi:hyperosmotically inducible protein